MKYKEYSLERGMSGIKSYLGGTPGIYRLAYVVKLLIYHCISQQWYISKRAM